MRGRKRGRAPEIPDDLWTRVLLGRQAFGSTPESATEVARFSLVLGIVIGVALARWIWC